MIQNNIGVIGSGSMATALIKIMLEDPNRTINWWVRNDDVRKGLEREHRNIKHLKELTLDTKRLNISGDLAEVVSNSHYLMLVIPSAYIGDTLESIPLDLYKGKQMISAIKGALPKRLTCVSRYLQNKLQIPYNDICVVSGPSHAEEVSKEMPTFLTIATANDTLASDVKSMLDCHYVFTNHTHDIDGVERCGLTKNIYAIAAGICQGLGYGDNLNAVLTTAALRELTLQLNTCMPDTRRDINLPCYLGDLMVTCWSRHSRNRALGEMVAKGMTTEEAFEKMGSVAEGYYSVRNLHLLATEKGHTQDIPIAEAVYRVLYEHADPKTEIDNLIKHVF